MKTLKLITDTGTIIIEQCVPSFIANIVRFNMVTNGVPLGQERSLPNLWEGIMVGEKTGTIYEINNNHIIELLHGTDEFKDYTIIN